MMSSAGDGTFRYFMPLVLARGHEAWRFATESLALARKTYARKHEARAQRLQGEILAAGGRISEAVPLFQSSVALAQELQT